MSLPTELCSLGLFIDKLLLSSKCIRLYLIEFITTFIALNKQITSLFHACSMRDLVEIPHINTLKNEGRNCDLSSSYFYELLFDLQWNLQGAHELHFSPPQEHLETRTAPPSRLVIFAYCFYQELRECLKTHFHHPSFLVNNGLNPWNCSLTPLNLKTHDTKLLEQQWWLVL
jgi:hypothetical protein